MRACEVSRFEVDEDYFEHVVDDLNDGSLSINVVDERVTISVDMWNAMVGEIGRLRRQAAMVALLGCAKCAKLRRQGNGEACAVHRDLHWAIERLEENDATFL